LHSRLGFRFFERDFNKERDEDEMTIIETTIIEAQRRAAACVVAGACLLLAGCGSAPDLHDERGENVAEASQAATPSTKKFGTWCQSGEYDIWPAAPGGPAPWLTPTGTAMCDNFAGEMAKTATLEFQYNLQGAAKEHWEKTWDFLSMEKVDLAFGYLHGGASAQGTADYGLWKDGVSFPEARVYTTNMRLGDETSTQRGLSVLATYSCSVLQKDDFTWARWGNVFRGGLRMVLASHKNVPFGSVADGIGKVFAQKLGAGATFKEAWRYALASTDVKTPVAVMATGDTAVKCGDRRDTTTFANFTTKGRLVDNNNKYFCTTTWEDQ
jgi:hypothetical protein